MALIMQGAAKPRGASSPRISSGPDHVAEAEQAGLKLRGDELLRDSSRTNEGWGLLLSRRELWG
jgi:hypothetical protein